MPICNIIATDVPSPCSNSPCKNGGDCTDSGTSFTCHCADGFSGPTCEGRV